MIFIGFLSGLGDSIIGAVGGIASTVLGNNSAKHEAEKNREWQEEMSNTSIQRRMKDLREAGLNPLLAVENASSGATTPSGSQAQIQRFDPAFLTALSNSRLVNAQAQAQENDNKLFDVKADILRTEAELKRMGLYSERIIQELNKAQTLESKSRVLVNEAQKKGIEMSIEEAKRKIKLLDIDLDVLTNGSESSYEGASDKYVSDRWNNIFSGVSYATSKTLRETYQRYNKWRSGFIDRLNRMKP